MPSMNLLTPEKYISSKTPSRSPVKSPCVIDVLNMMSSSKPYCVISSAVEPISVNPAYTAEEAILPYFIAFFIVFMLFEVRFNAFPIPIDAPVVPRDAADNAAFMMIFGDCSTTFENAFPRNP